MKQNKSVFYTLEFAWPLFVRIDYTAILSFQRLGKFLIATLSGVQQISGEFTQNKFRVQNVYLSSLNLSGALMFHRFCHKTKSKTMFPSLLRYSFSVDFLQHNPPTAFISGLTKIKVCAGVIKVKTDRNYKCLSSQFQKVGGRPCQLREFQQKSGVASSLLTSHSAQISAVGTFSFPHRVSFS